MIRVPDLETGSRMELYHCGIVVDDIEAAMAGYGAALDLTWAAVTPRAVRVVLDGVGEPREVELLATYSQQGPPYIELIQELRGDVWGRGALGLDHVGYWVPDLEEAGARLAAAGMSASVQAVDGDGQPTRFCYRRPASGAGPWIELVDVAVRPDLTAWIEGSPYVVP